MCIYINLSVCVLQLHSEYLADQQKIRQELLTQFKDELDSTRTELEAKYRETLKQELARITDKHRRELSAAKKKQWVGMCVCARTHRVYSAGNASRRRSITVAGIRPTAVSSASR
jgi:hypothetical protein